MLCNADLLTKVFFILKIYCRVLKGVNTYSILYVPLGVMSMSNDKSHNQNDYN